MLSRSGKERKKQRLFRGLRRIASVLRGGSEGKVPGGGEEHGPVCLASTSPVRNSIIVKPEPLPSYSNDEILDNDIREEAVLAPVELLSEPTSEPADSASSPPANPGATPAKSSTNTRGEAVASAKSFFKANGQSTEIICAAPSRKDSTEEQLDSTKGKPSLSLPDSLGTDIGPRTKTGSSSTADYSIPSGTGLLPVGLSPAVDLTAIKHPPPQPERHQNTAPALSVCLTTQKAQPPPSTVTSSSLITTTTANDTAIPTSSAILSISRPDPSASNWQEISDLAGSALTEEEREYLRNPQYAGIDSLQEALAALKTMVKQNLGGDYNHADVAKVNKMQEQLDTYSPVMESVVKYSPHGIGLIWGITKLMAQTSINKKKAFESFSKAIDTILDKLTICEFYAKTYIDKEIPSGGSTADSMDGAERQQLNMFLFKLDRALPQFYASVVVYAIKAYSYLQKGTRFVSFENSQKPYLDKILEAEQRMEKFANLLVMQRVQGISFMFNDLHSALSKPTVATVAPSSETRKQIEYPVDRMKPLRLVHYGENPTFTGREEIGQFLVDISAGTGHQRVAICGIGGVGKTQIAIRFVYNGVDLENTHVFWVHGGNPTSFKRTYKRIAELIDSRRERQESKFKTTPKAKSRRFNARGQSRIQQLEDEDALQFGSTDLEDEIDNEEDLEDDETMMYRVRDWLEDINDTTGLIESLAWVLVVDNADNPSDYEPGNRASEIARYLPQSGRRMLLITTRTSSVASQMGCKAVIVDKMELNEATSLFNKIYFSDPESQAEIARLGARPTELLPQLLTNLDLLPLAIVAAATFIRRTHSTIQEYLDMMQSIDKTPLLSKFTNIHRENQQEDGSDDSEVPESVITTFHITFSRIDTLEYGNLATDLLGVLSFIDRRAVPQHLLKRAVEESAGMMEFRVALGHLLDFCLITMNADGTTYDMHRLVHHSAKLFIRRASEDRWTSWQYTAYKTIAKLFPGLIKRSLNAGESNAGSVYRPHANELITSILPLFDKWQNMEDRLGFANLLQEVGCMEPPSSESDLYLEKAFDIFTTNGNEVDLAKVDLRRGVVCTERKEADPALRFTISALETMMLQLGPQHYETIFCYTRISQVHDLQKDFSSSFKALSSALEGANATLEKTDPLFCSVLARLGAVLIRRKAYGRAIQYLERVRDIQLEEARSKAVESYNPEYLCQYWLPNLSRSFDSLQRYDMALEAQNCRLWVAVDRFGEDSPEALAATNAVGNIKYKLGDLWESIDLHSKVLATTKKVFGEEHEIAAEAERGIGRCYLRLERFDDASQHYEMILSRMERLYGKHDTKTIDLLRTVGRSFYNHRGLRWSLEWYERAYNRQEQKFKLLFAPLDLHDKNKSLKRTTWKYIEAPAKKYEEESRRQIRKEEETKLVDVLVAIADTLFSLKRYPEALKHYHEILQARRRMHPIVPGSPADEAVVSSMLDIAKCHLEVSSQYNLALQWYIDAFNAATGLNRTLEDFEIPNAIEDQEIDWDSESSVSMSSDTDDDDGVESDECVEDWELLSAGTVDTHRKGKVEAERKTTFGEKRLSSQALSIIYSIGDIFNLLIKKRTAISCYIKFLQAAGVQIDDDGRTTNFTNVLNWLSELRYRREKDITVREEDCGDSGSSLPDTEEPADLDDVELAEGIIKALGEIGTSYFHHLKKPKRSLYYHTLELEASTSFYGELHEATLSIHEDIVWRNDWLERREEAYILMLSLLRKVQELHGDHDQKTIQARKDANKILYDILCDDLDASGDLKLENPLRSNLEWHFRYMEKMLEGCASKKSTDEQGYGALRGILTIADIYLVRRRYDEAWQLYEKIRGIVDQFKIPETYKVISSLLRSRQLAIDEQSSESESEVLVDEGVRYSNMFNNNNIDLLKETEYAYVDIYAELAAKYELHFSRPDLAYMCLNKCVPVMIKLVKEFGTRLIQLLKNIQFCENYRISRILGTLESMARISPTQKGCTTEGGLDYKTSIKLYETTIPIRLEIAKRAMEEVRKEGDDLDPEEDWEVSNARLQIAVLTESSGDFAAAELLYRRIIAARKTSYLRIVTSSSQLKDSDSKITIKPAGPYYNFLVESITTLADLYTKLHKFDLAARFLRNGTHLRTHMGEVADGSDGSGVIQIFISRIQLHSENWDKAAALKVLDEAFTALDRLSVGTNESQSEQEEIHNNRAVLLYQKAELLSNFENHTEAAASYSQSAHHHSLTHRATRPENCLLCIKCQTALALSKAHTGDLKEGKQACRQAIAAYKRLHPKGPKLEEGHHAMAQLYMKEARWDRASKELRIVLGWNKRADAASSMKRARAKTLLAVCSREMGNGEVAKELASEAKLLMEKVSEKEILERCVWFREVLEEMEKL